jgi:hypothetical protein
MLNPIASAAKYDWKTWFVGIMRSTLSGGALAILNTTGVSLILPGNVNTSTTDGRHTLLVFLVTFFLIGAGTHMMIFLSTHGAPDPQQQNLDDASTATKAAVAAVDAAKAAGPNADDLPSTPTPAAPAKPKPKRDDDLMEV